jgi:hypothetical protein
MRRSRHWLRSRPISISTMLSWESYLGVVELQVLQDAVRLGRRESLVERTRRMGRQIAEHDADQLGLGIVNVDEIAHAYSEVQAVRRSVTLDVHCLSVVLSDRLTVSEEGLHSFTTEAGSACGWSLPGCLQQL